MDKENASSVELPESGDIEIIGIRFRDAGKVYYFYPSGIKFEAGDFAVVETARGIEYGYVSEGNRMTDVSKIVPPLRPAVRKATEADTAKYEDNKRLEAEAFDICKQKIAEHKLGMKLISAEYTLDNSKLLFYYSAEIRVDFRELVKDLRLRFPHKNRAETDRNPRRSENARRAWRMRSTSLLLTLPLGLCSGFHQNGEGAESIAQFVENIRRLRSSDVLSEIRTRHIRG